MYLTQDDWFLLYIAFGLCIYWLGIRISRTEPNLKDQDDIRLGAGLTACFWPILGTLIALVLLVTWIGKVLNIELIKEKQK